MNQRERLLEGMVHAASHHGHGGASVARVIEAAGVSRATFYQHFRGKEECFLAAYRQTVEEMRASVRRAAENSHAAERPRAVLEALFAAVAANPDRARLVLVEALAGSPAIRAEHEKLIVDVEASIERHLGSSTTEAPTLQIPAAALLGGVAGVLSMRVFTGQGMDSLNVVLEELLAWVDSYALSPGEPRLEEAGWMELGRGPWRSQDDDHGVESLPDLPRGRHAFSPLLAARVRREHIVAATASAVAANGYAATTVAEIVARAGVTRGAFYSHFHGKQDAFLAAQTTALQESIAAAAGEFFLASRWTDQVWGGVRGMFGYVAHRPDLAFLELIETYAAGEAAIRRAYDNRMAYRLYLEDGYRQSARAARLPRLCAEAIAGATFGLMRRQVLLARTTEMLEIAPQAAYVALAPFTGPAPAMRFVEARARLGRRGPQRAPAGSAAPLAQA